MAAVIYMFHAIGEVTNGDWADKHYSFSEGKFKEFLSKAGSIISIEQLISEKKTNSSVVTFDDGHISNYWAGKYIAKKGYGSANFFINPAHVGKNYYMNWQQINELAELGMSIQSHGLDHRYFSDLNDEEIIFQLKESKRIIEEKINTQVTIVAPPGGRYDERTIKAALSLDYEVMAVSKPGRVTNTANFLLPRIAVMKNSSVDKLLASKNPINPRVLFKKLKYSGLKFSKTIIGNERYERIRWFLLGDGR